MKIALVHSFYRQGPSGENSVVTNQLHALENAGHQVLLVAEHSDRLQAHGLYPLKAAHHVATGSGASPVKEISQFNPDVVHVHNLFPNFSLRALAEIRYPVVSTVHNFRSICPAGTLFLKGEHCERCPSSTSLHSVKNGCYRNSRLQTVPLAINVARGLTLKALKHSSRLIFLSDKSRDIMNRLAPELEKTPSDIVPNFARESMQCQTKSDNETQDFYLFAGRLSEEKGIRELIQEWPSHEQLMVAGSGPLEAELKTRKFPNISFLGSLSSQRLEELMRKAQGLVFPSLCIDQSPLVVWEAMKNGLPVIARDNSPVAAEITQSGAGVAYKSLRRLDEILATVRQGRTEMSLRARKHFNLNHSEAVWVERVSNTYRAAIDSATAGGVSG